MNQPQSTDEITQFLKDVRDYLSQHSTKLALVEVIDLQRADGELCDDETRQLYLDCEDRRLQARADLLRSGRRLAEMLESRGEDASGVLMILHCADGGGGPEAVLPRWPAVKVQLQRLDMQSSRLPLSPHACKVYEMLRDLPEHEAMTAPMILDTLIEQSVIIDESTLRGRVFSELKSYGLQNKPRIGYFIRD